MVKNKTHRAWYEPFGKVHPCINKNSITPFTEMIENDLKESLLKGEDMCHIYRSEIIETKPLTLEILLVGNCVGVKVIKQDENLIKRGDFCNNFNEITFSSKGKSPELYWSRVLYVRGYDKTKDLAWTFDEFDSFNAANLFIMHLKQALKEMEKCLRPKINKQQKIIDFMKWKRDEILKYQIENDLEPIVYCNESDLDNIKKWHDNDIDRVHDKLNKVIDEAIVNGLNSFNCPYCIIFEDNCLKCTYEKNHGMCNDAGSTFLNLKKQRFLGNLFPDNKIKNWWNNYKGE